LNSKEYKDINIINPAEIIDDLIHFTIECKFDISMFLDLTNYLLSQETDYSTWYPVIKMFENLSNMIAFSLTYIKSIGLRIHMIKVKKFYLIKNTNYLLTYTHHCFLYHVYFLKDK